MSRARIVRITLALVIAGSIAFTRARDPEKQDMTVGARGAVPGKLVTLGAGVTHYQVAGPEDGPRVMLVHGFSVPSYIWDSTAVALSAAGFRVARYDMYGRGWSDRPDATYDLDLYDRQLEQLLDSLGWKEPVHLMGLSFGGPVTGSFTGKHPERVRSLTLVDPGAGVGGGVPWFLSLPGFGPMLWQAFVVPTMADGQAADFVEPSKWPDWADRYRVQVGYRGFGRSLLRTSKATAGVSYDSIFATVGVAKTPTLLIWGKEDQVVPIALADSVRAAIPQAQFHAIDKAGHLPHMERTDVVNPLMIGFLRSTMPAAADTTASSIK